MSCNNVLVVGRANGLKTQCFDQYTLIVSSEECTRSNQPIRGRFHRAANKQIKLFTRNICLARFLWLSAELSLKMYAFWLAVCFILLRKNICLAKCSAYEIGTSSSKLQHTIIGDITLLFLFVLFLVY